MSGPIRPEEVAAVKTGTIPQEVFDVINTLITQKATSSGVTILQRDIVTALVKKGLVTDNTDANRRGYLDFEEAYRAAGWRVEYDKPGFNESYPARFIFCK